MKNEILELSDLLVSAALNGVCQGIVVVVLVGIGLKLAGKTNAATRYAVWFCALLLVSVLPVAHAVRGFTAARSAGPVERIDGAIPPVLAAEVGHGEESGSEDVAANAVEMRDNPVEGLADITVEGSEFLTFLTPQETTIDGPVLPEDVSPSVGPQNEGVLRTTPYVVGYRDASIDQQEKSALQKDFTSTQGVLRWLRGLFNNSVSWNFLLGGRVPRYASVFLLALWGAVSAFKGGLLLWRLNSIRNLKRSSTVPGSELNHLFRNLVARLGIKRPVELRISAALKSPIVLGFNQPVVLYPSQEDVSQAEPVLRHELAHVRRRDDWTNLVQHSISSLLFFHPGVWWISRRLTLEREIACDDQVLQECARPQAYALLLTNLAGRMQGGQSLLAPGVSTNKSQLKQRIDMILDRSRNRSSRLEGTRIGLITCAAILVAAGAMYAAPRIVVTQDQAPPGGIPQIAVASSDAAVAVASDSIEEQNVGNAPGAPDAPEAPVPPKPPAPADIAPGPKYKPGEIRLYPHPPTAVMVAPAPVAPPAPIVAVAGPDQPRPAAPARNKNRDGSLEERLDRLERMVESMVAQQQGVKPRLEFRWKDSGDQDWKIDRKEIEKNEQMAKRQMEDARKQMDYARKQMDEQHVEKMKEEAKKEAMRAAEDGRRAGREAGRALAEQRRGDRDRMKEGSEKQLEALRRHQEELKREMERLDHQIKEIERHRDQADGEIDESIEQDENRNDNGNTNEESAPEPAVR